MPFRLKLLTPKGLLIDEDVDCAYFPSEKGPLGIFPDYDTTIFSLVPGVFKYSVSGKWHYFAIFGGACWVKKEETIAITELLEDAKDIDLPRAKAAKERALKAIEQGGGVKAFAEARAALNRAEARIGAKSLLTGEKK